MEQNKNNTIVLRNNDKAMTNNEANSTVSQRTHHYITAATSDNTRKAYQSDLRHFIQSGGLLPTTVDVLHQYITHHAEQLNPRTLTRRLTAIKQWHRLQGFSDPTDHPSLQKLLSGIKNVHGKPKDKAPPLTLTALASMVQSLEKSNTLLSCRNNALLQVGFFGAFRRSELVSIMWEQVQFSTDGIEIVLPRSKTDQEGSGQYCAIPYGNDTLCAVEALKSWQSRVQGATGPVFCQVAAGRATPKSITAGQVNQIIKQAAMACDLSNPERYSSHSLRRGFATEASKHGASFGAIMRQGRWRNKNTVFEYIEEGTRFESNAVDALLHSDADN